MHKPNFHQTPLARGIALALGLSSLTPGFAQSTDEQPAELEEIVVTGVRASLEASMDLGANSFQTFRHVILPNLGSALLAGGMLAFALSFDEVIVTTFTAGQQSTLPIWMLNELVRPRQRPVTNVVAIVVFGVVPSLMFDVMDPAVQLITDKFGGK